LMLNRYYGWYVNTGDLPAGTSLKRLVADEWMPAIATFVF
jgi:hypothetical protein